MKSRVESEPSGSHNDRAGMQLKSLKKIWRKKTMYEMFDLFAEFSTKEEPG